ncbi:LCP family protein [Butyrivibrio sp. WCD3002]|uniref:LCP family protein n=1 Tax=Butyrivibrio sp. WCD3002 TaxID=1280676 RepID=UPI00047DC761|nr:LCP family protein [Butyrivibrio sp. WCD3002]
MKGRLNKFLLIWAILVTVVLFGVGIFEVVRLFGKTNLFARKTNTMPAAVSTEAPTQEEETALQWEDDWVKHKGTIYDYNEDIMTFLIMGIDKMDDEVKEVYGEINGGQADALFLLVFNPHDKTTRVIGINRNTMADVDIYDAYGNYVTTYPAQIAVQHGFGNGLEESCELQKRAVSNLFYELPIHGYAAINMSAITTINDAVGGVDIIPDEDFEIKGYEFKKGETVHLEGEQAFAFLQGRDTKLMGSADKRLDRQKKYLTAFINKVIEATEINPTLAIDIYKAISKQMVTDVSVDELSYIVSTVSKYSFNMKNFYLLSGKTVMGEKFEEFYPDMDAMYDMFLEIFYEKVQ